MLKEGAINQDTANDMKDAATKGFLSNMADKAMDAGTFQLDTILGQYESELGIFAQDLDSIMQQTPETLRSAISGISDESRAAIGTLLDQMAPTTEQIQQVKSQYEQAGMDVPEAISSFLQRVNLLENLTQKPNDIMDYVWTPGVAIVPSFKTTTEKLPEDFIGPLLPDEGLTTSATVEVETEFVQVADPLSALIGPVSTTQQVAINTVYDYSPFDAQNLVPEQDTLEPPMSVNPNYDYVKYNVLNLMSNVKTIRPDILVSPNYRYVTYNSSNLNGGADGDAYRGGIFGPNGYAGGGVVRGGSQLIEVA